MMRTRPTTAFAAAGLTLAGLVAGAAAAQAAPPGPQARHASPYPSASCQQWAKNSFVYIAKASGNPGKGLTVAGQTVRVHCGGPDDLQYLWTGKKFTGHLLPTARLSVLTYGANGPEDIRLAQPKFAHWVAADHQGSIYLVSGPLKAIRTLVEEYHP
jgi:hypothetical protein